MVQAYCLRRYVKYITHVLTVGEPKKTPKYLSLYRQDQDLCRYYNLIQQDGIVISNIVLIMAGLVLGLYTVLSLGSQISIPELSLFLTCAVDGFLFLMLYVTIMSQLYSSSKQVVKGKAKERLLSNIMIIPQQRRWIERYMVSLQPLKAYIGYVNYVDGLTPLVMLSFCFHHTLDLLLIDAE